MTIIAPISAANLGMLTLQPLPDVTPFTIRSGATYESILSGIRVWLRDELVPYLQDNSAEALFQSSIDTMVDTVNTALGAQAATVTAALNAAVQEIVTADIPITSALFGTMGYTLAPAPLGNGADDTANLQAAITAAQQTGGDVQLHAGTYNVTDLSTTAGFAQPMIRGRGMQYTILNVTGSGHGIKFNGGSGKPGGGGIMDVKITGAAATGVTFQGVNSCVAQRVWFKTLAVGVKFHNELLSNFTEFCVAVDCVFDTDVTLPVWYARSNSVESMHGSGFARCNIGAPNLGGPAVQIDSGCFPYGAPMDGTIFSHVNNQTLIVNNNTARHVSFKGNLDVEVQQSATGVVIGGGTGGVICLEGGIGGLGGVNSDLTLGKLTLTDSVLYTGGSTYMKKKPWSENKTLGPGTTNLLTSGSQQACIMHVEINGANYNYVQTLLVWRDSFNGNVGGVTILATHKSLNASGWGAPVFDYANGFVTVANANYPSSGVVAYVDVMPFNHDRSDIRFPQYH